MRRIPRHPLCSLGAWLIRQPKLAGKQRMHGGDRPSLVARSIARQRDDALQTRGLNGQDAQGRTRNFERAQGTIAIPSPTDTNARTVPRFELEKPPRSEAALLRCQHGPPPWFHLPTSTPEPDLECESRSSGDEYATGLGHGPSSRFTTLGRRAPGARTASRRLPGAFGRCPHPPVLCQRGCASPVQT